MTRENLGALATLPREIILEIFNYIDFFSTYAMIKSMPRLSKIHEHFEISREWMMAKFVEMIIQNDVGMVITRSTLPVSVYESSRDYLKYHYQLLKKRITMYETKDPNEEDHERFEWNPYHRRFVIMFQYFHKLNNFTPSSGKSKNNDDLIFEYLRMYRVMLQMYTLLTGYECIVRVNFFDKLMDEAKTLFLKYDHKLNNTKNLDKRHIRKNFFFLKIMILAEAMNETAKCLESTLTIFHSHNFWMPIDLYQVKHESFPFLLFCKYWKYITNPEEYRPLLKRLESLYRYPYLSQFCNYITKVQPFPNDFISSTEEYNRFFDTIKLLNEFSDKTTDQFQKIPVYTEAIEEQFGKLMFFKNNSHLNKEIIQFIYDNTFYYSDRPWFWR
ncbi:hypothetical protein C9374_004138 [Naegleria lovaniensis]|uniref:F-box domain-containing protein n=1 Tax=Naegleria lovaniensis TaxID=51637 RepID=A0AA88GSC6_NAELO|nr:uncharacterized protein C9374_004138 [Naegleria lovaniensis]KAG2383467.1 hypothetical protein C9374_004138 [Naegleria lovaniensis]